MRHKILQSIIHNIGQMSVGYQIQSDLEVFHRLGGGRVSINLLDGKCQWNGGDIEPLQIIPKLQSWLGAQLNKEGMTVHDISQLLITIECQFSEGPGYRAREKPWPLQLKRRNYPSWHYQIQCHGILSAFDKIYTSTVSGERDDI